MPHSLFFQIGLSAWPQAAAGALCLLLALPPATGHGQQAQPHGGQDIDRTDLGAPPGDRTAGGPPRQNSQVPRGPDGSLSPPETPEQRRQILTRLYGYLSSATSSVEAKRIQNSITRIWLHSGSPTTDILMQRAGRAMETRRWGSALTFIDAVVSLQPDFAEGWRLRAEIHAHRGRTTRALRDLRHVLDLEPNHFMALEQIGDILESIGEEKPALEAFRKLHRLHPQAPGIASRIEELTRKVEGQQI